MTDPMTEPPTGPAPVPVPAPATGAARVWDALCRHIDGVAIGAARALVEDGLPAVMLLSGGVLAESRGRGAYRALVRARWDDAVASGFDALCVHARQTSRPILERLGFELVAEHEILGDPATC